MNVIPKLIVDNPELLLYLDGRLHITIMGGIKLTGFDRLKVTLKIVSGGNTNTAFRHNLDLYNGIQAEQLVEKAAESLDMAAADLAKVISRLTTVLEDYRSERLEAMKPKQVEKKQLTEAERKIALQYLKAPGLLGRTRQAIASSGIIGEEVNSLIAYLIYTSRKRNTPLHLMCLGPSGSGKTWLQEKVSDLIPEEDKLEITVLSMNAFYYFAYSYNARGWLTQSSAPLFAMQLKYTNGTMPQYNGNIANQYWGTPGSMVKNYKYSYDPLNRLVSGIANTGNTEKSIVYDNLGNITGLQRWLNVSGTSTEVDALNYSYTGNQLTGITDSTSSAMGLKNGSGWEYQYDGNGNMTYDQSKGLSVTYNLLNLPQANTLTGGTVTYTYDATGRKLRKYSTLGSGSYTDYADNVEYDNGYLSFVQTEEGRALYSNTDFTYNYEYNLADHLGNVRVSFDTKTGTADTTQRDDYLPFGMEVNKYVVSPKNEYLYNKKELQEETGQYDYGARFYDPVIARWSVVDRYAEKYQHISPYGYASNNPIRYMDMNGDSIIISTAVTHAGTANPQSTRQLGDTHVKSVGAQLTSSTNVNVNVNVVENLSAAFVGSTPQTNIETQNPGLEREVDAHEKGHVAQITQGANMPVTINITIDGKVTKFTGAADVVILKATDAFNTSTDATKMNSSAQGTFLNSNVISPVYSQMRANINTLTQGPNAENDADNRASSQLGASTIKYNNGKTPIKYNGTTLPNN